MIPSFNIFVFIVETTKERTFKVTLSHDFTLWELSVEGGRLNRLGPADIPRGLIDKTKRKKRNEMSTGMVERGQNSTDKNVRIDTSEGSPR